MSFSEGGFLPDLMETMQYWYDRGVRMFKFDFVDFSAATPATENTLSGDEIRARNENAFREALRKFRQKNPDVVYTPPTADNPVPTGNLYFPSTVATNPEYGQLGKGPARIDALRAFGQIREDASIMKYFNIGTEGRYKLSIRAEFYNIFNRHTFQDPVTKLDDDAFGYVLGVNSSPRTGQFGARFEW